MSPSETLALLFQRLVKEALTFALALILSSVLVKEALISALALTLLSLLYRCP